MSLDDNPLSEALVAFAALSPADRRAVERHFTSKQRMQLRRLARAARQRAAKEAAPPKYSAWLARRLPPLPHGQPGAMAITDATRQALDRLSAPERKALPSRNGANSFGERDR